MITEKDLKRVFDLLTADEAFCRFVYYGVDALNETKQDIKTLDNYQELMKNSIRFAPQVDDIEPDERVRINMYKQQTKLRYGLDVVRNETIQFDIYVPHRFNKEDFRTYQIENKISAILDGIKIGIGFLDYIDGSFVQITNVAGYTQYKMIFSVEEGRSVPYGKL